MNRRSFLAALPLVPAAIKAAQAKPNLSHGSCSISTRGADAYMRGVKEVSDLHEIRIGDFWCNEYGVYTWNGSRWEPL